MIEVNVQEIYKEGIGIIDTSRTENKVNNFINI